MEGLYISVLFLAILTVLHIYEVQKLEKQIHKHFCGVYAILHKKFGISGEEIAENLEEYAKNDIDFICKQ